MASDSKSHSRAPTTILGGFYFLNYSGLGSLWPFLPLLLADRGLSATQIALVMMITPLFNLLMPPIWGSVADALQARLMLLRVATFSCGLAVLSLLPAWGFWGNLLAVVLISTFRTPIASLADSATYVTMTRRGGAYGHIRVWGSIGFVVGALLVGRLGGSTCPRLMLAVAAGSYFSSGFFTLAMPASSRCRERGVLGEALTLLRQPDMLLFLAGNITYYFAHGILDAYLSPHLRGLGFDDSVISQAWVIGVAAEVLVMFAAPRLIAGRPGSPLLAACSLISAARWHLLSRWRSCGLLLALQSLHGITYGLWHLTLVQHVQARAPERLRTTLQASAYAALGLGATIGYLAGGRILEQSGTAAVFDLATKVALGSLVCYALMPLGEKPRSAALRRAI